MQKGLFLLALTIGIMSPYFAHADVEISDGSVKALYHLEDTSDSSGNGYTLTNNNQVAFNTGKFGNAADGAANNTSTYLSVASNLGINGGSMSISAWVKMTGTIANNTMQMAVGHSGSAYPYVQEGLGAWHDAGVKKSFAYRAKNQVQGNYATYNASIDDGAWHHLAITYDGSDLTQFLDGLRVASTSSTGWGNSGNSDFFQILAHNSADFFKGLVDEVVILDNSITLSDVALLYSSGSGLEVCSTYNCGF